MSEGKKLLISIFISMIACILVAVFTAFHQQECLYKDLQASIETGNWIKAKEYSDSLGNYKDNKTLSIEINYQYNNKRGDDAYKNEEYEKAIMFYNRAKESKIDDRIIIEKIKTTTDIKNKLIEEKKKAKLKQISTLKNHMRITRDNVENVTWYQDKTSPAYINYNQIKLGLAQSGDKLWMRFVISYAGDDWVFFDKIIFNIDGNIIEKSYSMFEKKTDVVFGAGVYESVDLPYEGYEHLIDKIIASKNTTIKFRGKYSSIMKISENQKQAMKRVLELYKLLNEK